MTAEVAPLVVVPVILAGGSGTRLWPLSRSLHPKQYLALGIGGKGTLFQQAAQRLATLAEPGLDVRAPCVVANEEHRFTVVDQLREVGIEPARVLLEPVGRNTAPALALAAHEAAKLTDGDPILVVTPADHAIGVPAAFTSALRQAVRAAAGGDIVVLGIRPDRPDTGYGYIRAAGEPREGAVGVAAFVEKPDLRDRRALSRRWRLLLEQRHVRAARERLAGRARPLSARHRGGERGRLAHRGDRWRIPALRRQGVRRDPRRQHRLRRDGAGEPRRCRRATRRASAWCRSMPAGATSAPGTRSGRSASATATATPPTATPWCANRATPWSTRPAAWSASSASTT